MMKKLLGIVVLGLLLSGNAYAIKLTECYRSSIIEDGVANIEEIVDKFENENYETNSFEIDLRNGIIKRQIIRTDKYVEEQNRIRAKDLEDSKYTDEEKALMTNSFPKISTSTRKINYADDRIISSEKSDISSVQGNGGVVDIINESVLKIDLKKFTAVYTTTFKIDVAGIPKSTSISVTTFNCKGSKSSSGTDIASSGSGFFINNKGYFITNNHVVDGCTQSKITFDEKSVDAELIAKDETLDLALLRAKVKPKDYLNISDDPPEKMQKIFVAGYPFGKGLSDDLKFSQGIISSVKGFADNSNQIQIDAAINSGNSGGPIVNEDGDLVAVAVSGLDKSQSEGIGFGIKASSVKNFLEVNDAKYSSSSLISFGMNNKKLNKLMEASAVYTFCN